MNNSEKIFLVAKAVKNMYVNISDFTDLLRDTYIHTLQPIIDREIMRTGLFAVISDCKIWIGPMVDVGFIHISDKEISDTSIKQFDATQWSEAMDLNNNEWIEKLELIA